MGTRVRKREPIQILQIPPPPPPLYMHITGTLVPNSETTFRCRINTLRPMAEIERNTFHETDLRNIRRLGSWRIIWLQGIACGSTYYWPPNAGCPRHWLGREPRDGVILCVWEVEVGAAAAQAAVAGLTGDCIRTLILILFNGRGGAGGEGGGREV